MRFICTLFFLSMIGTVAQANNHKHKKIGFYVNDGGDDVIYSSVEARLHRYDWVSFVHPASDIYSKKQGNYIFITLIPKINIVKNGFGATITCSISATASEANGALRKQTMESELPGAMITTANNDYEINQAKNSCLEVGVEQLFLIGFFNPINF